MISGDRTRERQSVQEIVGLVGLALIAGVYFVLRPGGLWAESDSGSMAQGIRAVVDTGQLAPHVDAVYGNGYGYQAVSTAIMAFTGLSVETLQQLIYPVISAFLVLPAWALYREISGSGRVASLATLLLLLVPEYLFAVLRGSHERLDRAFLLITLWLLFRSLRFRGDRVRFATHVILVLVMTYGLIATNALFGMSFVAAIATALAVSWLARRGPGRVRPLAAETTRLLRWTTGAAVLLVAIFLLFVYPPVDTSLRALSTLPGTILNLILNGATGVDPYSGILGAWVSPAAYLILSMADFLILGVSALIWLRLGWSWLRGGRPESLGVWMLWLLYAALAAQGAAGILSDRTGALQGNVQYRTFSVFATVAAPLVAITLSRWNPRPLLRGLAVATLTVAAVSALLKTTLDPAVSNKWLFYTTSELEGLRWADAHQRGTDTWVGADDRLTAVYALAVGDPTAANRWEISDPKPDTESFLVSDVIRLQDVRLGKTLPALESTNLLYDGGSVQLYRVRALAAFDR